MDNTQLRQHAILFLKSAIDDGRRNNLRNDIDYLIPVLSGAVASVDLENGLHRDTVFYNLGNGKYSKQVMDNYHEYHFNTYVPCLLEQYKNTKTDVEYDFSKEKQIEILKNTLNFFQALINDMECDQEIKTIYIKISNMILKKLNGTYQKTNPILTALRLSKMNYVLEDEIYFEYYPFVLDILFDTFRLDCAVKIDPEFTDAIRSMSSAAQIEQREKLFSMDDFLIPRVDFLHHVNRDQVESFILSFYHDVLECEYNDIKSIYKQLLFEHLSSHKHKYEIKLNISKISQKIYFRHFSSLIQ